MDKDTLRDALKRVEKDLATLTDEEFRAELEKHKDGDIAKILLRIWRDEAEMVGV